MESQGQGSTEWPKIPVGIPSVDRQLRGGVRPGTTLLLTGPEGAGQAEFIRTAAVMHGNWQAGSGLFDLEYDGPDERVVKPSQVRYVSMNDSSEQFRRNVHDIANSEWVEPALDNLVHRSLAKEVADLGPIQPSDDERHLAYASDGTWARREYERVFRALDVVIQNEPGEVVLLDAISDFLPITARFLDPVDTYFIAQTLCYLTAATDSVLVAVASTDMLTDREVGMFRRAFEAVLDFDWFGEGTLQSRTMSVTKFPEFWHESDTEGRVTFDLDIDRDHFGISRTQKIR